MTPKVRVIGFSITVSFIVLFAYLLGMFDASLEEFTTHDSFRTLVVIFIFVVSGHATIEFLQRFHVVGSRLAITLHRILFVVFILIVAGILSH